jgi:hypothetical protein
MRDAGQVENADSDFLTIKLANLQLNRAELKRAMKKRFDRSDTRFLNHDTVDGVGPWGKASNSA